jgi:hypothetical protein
LISASDDDGERNLDFHFAGPDSLVRFYIRQIGMAKGHFAIPILPSRVFGPGKMSSGSESKQKRFLCDVK